MAKTDPVREYSNNTVEILEVLTRDTKELNNVIYRPPGTTEASFSKTLILLAIILWTQEESKVL